MRDFLRLALDQRHVKPQQGFGAYEATLLLQHAPEIGALGQQLGEQAVKAIRAHAVGNVQQGGANFRRAISFRHCQNRIARRLQQVQRLAVIEHGEMRDDAGLDRKELQHAFAKGMDGLDLEAARCFECAGKELAGALEKLRIGIG